MRSCWLFQNLTLWPSPGSTNRRTCLAFTAPPSRPPPPPPVPPFQAVVEVKDVSQVDPAALDSAGLPLTSYVSSFVDIERLDDAGDLHNDRPISFVIMASATASVVRLLRYPSDGTPPRFVDTEGGTVELYSAGLWECNATATSQFALVQQAASPSPSPSAGPMAGISPEPSPSPSPGASTDPSPSPSAGPIADSSPDPSPRPSPSSSASPGLSAAPSPTASPRPTANTMPSPSPSPRPGASTDPSPSPSPDTKPTSGLTLSASPSPGVATPPPSKPSPDVTPPAPTEPAQKPVVHVAGKESSAALSHGPVLGPIFVILGLWFILTP